MDRPKANDPAPPQGAENPLDPQLESVARRFDEVDIPYWLDAGSLLALVREGRLFPGDKDVDLGVWAKELDQVASVMRGLKDQGHRVVRERWHDKTFKYKVYPRKGEAGRVIDLQVYRRSNDHAWSPLHTVADYDYTWYDLPLLLRGAIRWPWRMWLAHRAQDVEIARFPWDRIGWKGTWWVPAHHFERTKREGPYRLPFPDKKEEYLAYRYGDWKRPQGDWIYWRDDGAYRKGPPDRLLGD